MWWLNAVGSWLLDATVFGAIILFLGGLAVWFCREPVYRIRIIHWTFIACLLVPLLQQGNIIPKYSLNLWQETGSNIDPLSDQNRSPESAEIVLMPPQHTEVAMHEPPLPFNPMTKQNADTVPRETLTPAEQVAPQSTTGGVLTTIIFRALQMAYLAIVGFLFVRAALGFVRRSRIARSAQPASAELCELLTSIAGSHTQNARLLVSQQVRSPFMWGLSRPTIVIPAALAAEESAAQLRWCLAHEWSHVLRRDFSTLLLANLVKFVCFYQPVYWWLRRQLTLSQDFLADAFAAQQGDSTEDYASFLVSLARAESQPKLAGTLGIRDQHSQLLQRINMLVKSVQPLLQCENRISTIAIIVSALIVVGGLSALRLSAAPLDDQVTAAEKKTASQTEKPPAATALDAKPRDEIPKQLPQPITYNGKVVDQKTGQPIADATVIIKRQLNTDPQADQRTTLRTTTHKTDAQGNYRFTLSAEEVAESQLYLNFEIQHPQYEFRRKSNSHAWILKNLKNGNLPFFSTIQLFPGKTVSAVVLQPDGTPAANIRVLVFSKPTQKDSGYHSFLDSQTDENGRFEVVVARPGEGVVWVLPEHFSPLTAYLNNGLHGDIGPLQLQKGTRMAGQVLDRKGKAVPNVAVNLYRKAHLKNYDGYLESLPVLDHTGTGTVTDADGRFKLTPLPSGRYNVSVDDRVYYGYKGPGREQFKVDDVFVPFEITIREDETNEPIEIRAVPQIKIRGRLFDSQGNPLASYPQRLTGWYPNDKTAYDLLVWTKSTAPGNDGWFEFKVPRGIVKTEFNLHFGQGTACRWRLKPGAPLKGGKIVLGTLEEDFSTLEAVRYVAPDLFLKVVDEHGHQLSQFNVKSKYHVKPPEKDPFHFSDETGDVNFLKQADGRRRSLQLLPDQEITISIEKQGFTTEPQTVTLKEAEVRELVFVLKKTE
ncbi:M56 family metallopeptidase [Gimesia algae]|uniref:BlaR1 peptidase M56 n=1 Tax=Gimesia algae TaxID=2527971 RepID=A0A517V5Z0_9PLAN|nr:M56 family metallopeptidase [Gimesia algae]QDT88421.1 BlaR1 peptidase M56 [Gimesia algae]